MQTRKQKRDARNARHRANEQRRWDRKVDKWFGPALGPLVHQAGRGYYWVDEVIDIRPGVTSTVDAKEVES